MHVIHLTNCIMIILYGMGWKVKGKSDIEMYRLPDGGGIYKIIFIAVPGPPRLPLGV